MTFPAPKQGLVIRYAFLWSHERDAGADEGSKDRPCAIVVATSLKPDGEIQVIVSPITHRPAEDSNASIEIPRAVCRRSGSMPVGIGSDWKNSIASVGRALTCGRFRVVAATSLTACYRQRSSKPCGRASWRAKRN